MAAVGAIGKEDKEDVERWVRAKTVALRVAAIDDLEEESRPILMTEPFSESGVE